MPHRSYDVRGMVNGILAVLPCDITGLINLGVSKRKLEVLFQFENGLNSCLSLVKVYPDLCVIDTGLFGLHRVNSNWAEFF